MSEKKYHPIVNKANRVVKKLSNEFFVFRTFFSTFFLVLAFFIFSPLIRRESDWLKLFVIAYGVFVLVTLIALFYEYVLKTIRLQRAEIVKSYSVLLSVNTVFGLIIPLMFFNIVSSTVVKALNSMGTYNTIFCELRRDFVLYYYNMGVFTQVNNLVFWIAAITVGVLLIGSTWERVKQE